MTTAHATSPATRALIERLEAHASALRARAREADEHCRLPAPTLRTLLDLELFRIWIPREFGGLELSLPEALELYQAAARIDGSVGWAVMIGSGGGLFAAWLDPAAARDIFAPRDAVIAGSGAPEGKAERIDGGYRITGRWRYASGAHYATTFTANCVLHSGKTPLQDAEGRPLVRAMAFDPSQVRILPTWNPGGMRGTGSHDFEVEGAFVPEARSFSLFIDAPRLMAPLYRLPFGVLTELPIAAVALGIAAHALESFAELARARHGSDAARLLADESWVQARYAESHARRAATHARIHGLAREMAGAAGEGRPLSPRELATITAACAQGVSELCAVVGALAGLAGMAAISHDHEFARAWRDLQTLAAHVAVSPARLAAAGGVLLSPAEAAHSPSQ